MGTISQRRSPLDDRGVPAMSSSAPAVRPGDDADFPDSRPLPLLANRHVQTFLGALLPGPSCPPQRKFVVRLDDGDAILLYDNWPRFWRPGDPIAVLIHGLGGS